MQQWTPKTGQAVMAKENGAAMQEQATVNRELQALILHGRLGRKLQRATLVTLLRQAVNPRLPAICEARRINPRLLATLD